MITIRTILHENLEQGQELSQGTKWTMINAHPTVGVIFENIRQNSNNTNNMTNHTLAAS